MLYGRAFSGWLQRSLMALQRALQYLNRKVPIFIQQNLLGKLPQNFEFLICAFILLIAKERTCVGFRACAFLYMRLKRNFY